MILLTGLYTVQHGDLRFLNSAVPEYYLFIYLLHSNLNPATAESVHMNTKGREKKERQVRLAKKRKGIEA